MEHPVFQDDAKYTLKCFSWRILLAHSKLTTQELGRVFEPVPDGVRKIVLSTNICESSVTLPDLSLIVDLCRARETR